MTPEEFQNWIGNSKIDTTIESLSKSNLTYSLNKAWKHIQIGKEYWFFNMNVKQGPMDWMKLKVTYKRSGIFFYKVLDKRYKMDGKEEYADIESVFTRHLHPAVYHNPSPEYFKESNFDTLDGRIRVI